MRLTHRLATPFAVLALLASGACSSSTGNTGTGGQLPQDTSGAVSDAAGGSDGAANADTGATGADASSGGDAAGGSDAATGGDTGGLLTDGGGAKTDAGGGTTDAGGGTTDAGGGSDGGPTTPGSCKNRCGDYDAKASCQCDSLCEGEGDCCKDYAALCKKPECAKDADCDDKNACTADKCVDAKLCENKPTNEGGTCDDGKVCTDADKCTKGSCKGTQKATDTPCDDGNICTTDSKCSSLGNCLGKSKDCDDDEGCTLDTCDKATGNCKNEVKKDDSYCTDGNACTTDGCKAGKCASTPKKDGTSCSDGNACTEKDGCAAGTCTGTNVADGKSCSDGNTCTKDDKCTAGACSGTADAAKDGATCSDDDPCTSGTKCASGTCTGPQNACDDDNPCTADSCTKKSTYSKTCKNELLKAGAACNDGDPCTDNDACSAAGKCEAKASGKCTTALTDAFECGKNGSWVFAPAADDAKSVVGWGIDATPATPAPPSPKCSLNFNNGKDFVSKVDGKSVAAKGSATSGEIDLSNAGGAKVSYQMYYDTETYSSADWMFVEVSDDDFKTTAASWELEKDTSTKAKWFAQTHDLSKWAGKKIKLRFRFDSKDTITNTGAGWFIDDLKVEVAPK